MRCNKTGTGIPEKIFRYTKIYQSVRILFPAGILLICCIFTGIFLLRRESSKAAEADNGYKSYTSVEIKAGDSLWSIASEYMTEDYDSVQEYVRDIKSLNGLGGDEIHAGKFLLVPYYLHP